MSGLPWLRLYSEMPHDERIEEIAFEDRWHYVNVLCMKCSGLLDKEFQNERMRERKISRELGLDSDTAGFVKERLTDVGLIGDDWNPKGWDKRQLRSDHDPSNAERQRRYREKKKVVTLRNVTVTGADTDTDTDTEVKKGFTLPKKIDESLWKEWMQVRSRLKAVNSDRAKKMLITELEKCESAGFNVNDAIKTAIGRSWKSVDPEWLSRLKPKTQAQVNRNDPNSMIGVAI